MQRNVNTVLQYGCIIYKIKHGINIRTLYTTYQLYENNSLKIMNHSFVLGQKKYIQESRTYFFNKIVPTHSFDIFAKIFANMGIKCELILRVPILKIY